MALAESINFTTGVVSESLVYEMPRGKKGDEYANTTYAQVRFWD